MDEWKLALAKKRGGGHVGVGGVCGGGGGNKEVTILFSIMGDTNGHYFYFLKFYRFCAAE